MGIGGHRMSEVEKLYKNAGVEKQYYYFDSADGNTYTWELNENGNDKHNMCFIGKPKIKDREFTAEKQIELIKWLSNNDKDKNKEMCIYNSSHPYFYFGLYHNEDIEDNSYGYGESLTLTFEEGLANLINNLWQSLTEQERTEIRSILECY